MVLLTLIPILMFVEHKLGHVLRMMTYSSSYFNTRPTFLISYSSVLIPFAYFGYLIYRSEVFTYDPSSVSIYLHALTESTLVFMVTTILKCFLLGIGVIDIKMARKGFLGLFERFFIIIRNIIVAPQWISYFSGGCGSVSYLSYIICTKSLSCFFYILIKWIFFIWLICEFIFTLNDYSANSKASLRNVDPKIVVDECVFCYSTPVEPVALRCGHIFCYECITRWIRDYPTCPVCRAQIIDARFIEFADGGLLLTVLFGAF